MEKGAILLDHEGKDLTNVLSSIVEALISIGYIDDDIGSILLRILLYRHKYVDGKINQKLHSGSHRHKSMASIYHTDYSGVSRVMYDRVRNRKIYFEIAASLNFKRGTSRAGNSN